MVLLAFWAAFGGTVLRIDVEGTIDPPVSQYVGLAIDRAHREGIDMLLLVLDTPGGLMSSTKEITGRIVNSDVPVAVYVYPRGARAASAGVFITMAAHVAAMAPGTHIGAAHPVALGMPSDTSAVMDGKITNDAVAWIRSLAQLRGRNTRWAEKAVRESASITAFEAESLGVIDFVAESFDDLLNRIKADPAKFPKLSRKIEPEATEIVKMEMTLPQRFLHTILNPNLAYLLLMLGLLGIYFEFQHPGAILPGVVGVLSLLSAAYAFQILPVNYVGILFIIAGIGMFILEVKVPGFGLLTAGGALALFLGSLMLTSGNPPELRISLWTILPTVAFVVLLFVFVVTKALMIQRKKPATGLEGLLGEIGEVIDDIPEGGEGKVLVHGEIWNARSNKALPRGTKVRVVAVQRMTITVEEEK